MKRIADRPHGTRRSTESQTVLAYMEFAGKKRYRLALADSSKDAGNPLTIKAWVCYQHPPPLCSRVQMTPDGSTTSTDIPSSWSSSTYSVQVSSSRAEPDQSTMHLPARSLPHASGGSHLLAWQPWFAPCARL